MKVNIFGHCSRAVTGSNIVTCLIDVMLYRCAVETLVRTRGRTHSRRLCMPILLFRFVDTSYISTKSDISGVRVIGEALAVRRLVSRVCGPAHCAQTN